MAIQQKKIQRDSETVTTSEITYQLPVLSVKKNTHARPSGSLRQESQTYTLGSELKKTAVVSLLVLSVLIGCYIVLR